MDLKELAAKIKALRDKYWEKPPARVLHYGPHDAVWGDQLTRSVTGSCYVCEWCGTNEHNTSWTDADAYTIGMRHTRNEHPGMGFEIIWMRKNDRGVL